MAWDISIWFYISNHINIQNANIHKMLHLHIQYIKTHKTKNILCFINLFYNNLLYLFILFLIFFYLFLMDNLWTKSTCCSDPKSRPLGMLPVTKTEGKRSGKLRTIY